MLFLLSLSQWNPHSTIPTLSLSSSSSSSLSLSLSINSCINPSPTHFTQPHQQFRKVILLSLTLPVIKSSSGTIKHHSNERDTGQFIDHRRKHSLRTPQDRKTNTEKKREEREKKGDTKRERKREKRQKERRGERKRSKAREGDRNRPAQEQKNSQGR